MDRVNALAAIEELGQQVGRLVDEFIPGDPHSEGRCYYENPEILRAILRQTIDRVRPLAEAIAKSRRRLLASGFDAPDSWLTFEPSVERLHFGVQVVARGSHRDPAKAIAKPFGINPALCHDTELFSLWRSVQSEVAAAKLRLEALTRLPHDQAAKVAPSINASTAVDSGSWRVQLERLRYSLSGLREPRLSAAITVEPPSDTLRHPVYANDYLQRRGYDQHLECCPIRPPLDVGGWPGAIDVAADGEPVGEGSIEGSPAWRVWQRFREDAEKASVIFNEAPIPLRLRYGGKANADAEGWLALLFRHNLSNGKAKRLRCDNGENCSDAGETAWFACVTNLADASVDLINQLLEYSGPAVLEPDDSATWDAKTPEQTPAIPRNASEMLPAIESLRLECQSPNSSRLFLTFHAADRIAELWVDMHLLGWQPPPEPDLAELRCSSVYSTMVKGSPFEKRVIRERFDNALKVAERTARARLLAAQVNTESSDLKKPGIKSTSVAAESKSRIAKVEPTAKRERPTGDEIDMLITSVLHHHHDPTGYKLGNDEPLQHKDIVAKSKVSKASVSKWLKREFGSHKDYASMCGRNPAGLAADLRRLIGEDLPRGQVDIDLARVEGHLDEDGRDSADGIEGFGNYASFGGDD